MRVESEFIVWSLFDDMRSINFADERKFLSPHGECLCLK